MKQGKIVFPDKTGDTCIAEYDLENSESIKVAQDELTEFLDKCVREHKYNPPVWARRVGEKDMEPVMAKDINFAETDLVLIQQPLVGG